MAPPGGGVAAVHRAGAEAGITSFDTANVYSDGSSEEILGKVLGEVARRDEVVIATKLHGRMGPGPNGGGLSRGAVLNQVDASLRRLEAVDPDRRVVDAVGQVAAERGVPRAQVALAWLLAKEVVTAPIVGATKPRHLADALAALDLALTDDEICRLEEPYVSHLPEGY